MATVTVNPKLQVTGTIMMAPPVGNTYPRGIRSTSLPTVPPPQAGTSWPTTLTVGGWILDPSGQYVLLLDDTNGLTLYQLASDSPSPTTGTFEGDAIYGPKGGANCSCFLAQSDGNAVVYDSNFPQKLTPKWAANDGTDGSAQYFFVQENGCFVMIQCHGVWGTPL